MPTYLAERFETSTCASATTATCAAALPPRTSRAATSSCWSIEARENPSPFNDYNLGSEYLALSEPARAREHFERRGSRCARSSAGRAPATRRCSMARVVTARRGAGDFDAARAAIAEGLRDLSRPHRPGARAGVVRPGRGRPREAAELARRCLEMGDAPARYAATVGSGTYLAMTVLAEVERSQGRPDGAEKLYRRSLAEHPDYAAPVLPLVTLMLAARRRRRRGRSGSCRRPAERAGCWRPPPATRRAATSTPSCGFATCSSASPPTAWPASAWSRRCSREPLRRGRGRGRAGARGLRGRRPGRRRPAVRARRRRRRRGDGRRAGRGRAVAGTPRRRVLPGLGGGAERRPAAGDPAGRRRADRGDRAGGAAPRAGHRGIRPGAAAVAAARPEPARAVREPRLDLLPPGLPGLRRRGVDRRRQHAAGRSRADGPVPGGARARDAPGRCGVRSRGCGARSARHPEAAALSAAIKEKYPQAS